MYYFYYISFYLLFLFWDSSKNATLIRIEIKIWMSDMIDWLDVAKCNLGKVNLEAMLVSSFPSYTRGDPMPLAGTPCDLYTQLLACSSLQSVVVIACCLRAILCFGFIPSLPPFWGMGQVSIGRSVFHWIVHRDGAWLGPLAGLPWILPPHARALPGSTKIVGTNAQAHLLVMSLINFKQYIIVTNGNN